MKFEKFSIAAVLTCVALTSGCRQAAQKPPATETDLRARAERLAQDTLILDTHIDLPYRLNEKPEDVAVRTEGGHFDLVRARQGGLNAAFMSIYVPASLQEKDGARELADKLIDLVEGIEEEAPGDFAVARSVDDVQRLFSEGVFALPMGIENGAAIEDDLGALGHFFDRGVRYMTLAHSEPNLICDSSYSEDRRWNGLSPFGREVVAEMNRLGIMVDISHVTDETFYQAIEISTAPMIASHSCCRFFTPGFERNMTDDMITRLAEAGGVIQIAFAPGFLNEAAQKQSTDLWATMRTFMEENQVAMGSPEFNQRIDRYWQENPKVETTVSDVADHIEHIIQLVGVDHVGVGSDFDGISDTPTGLEDVSAYPALIEELLRRGLSDEEIRKITGGNLLRVWSEVERHAAGI
ncbi:MAG: dipeptidase [Acidobacteria bacterium]|jgi:membrane dipeptidase|nr:dipeptidase [Acidobacteriota bacterium]